MPERKNCFYRLLPLVAVVIWLLDSCQKKNDILEPGVSYGITGVEPAMAASGDTISVFGAGFATDTSGNTITFNGTPAKVVSASAELLRIVVPVVLRQPTVEVKTGTKSASYSGSFTVATVISGNQDKSFTWTPDNLYLLKGDVHFTRGTTLTIQAGTSILADKASLTIDDGATISMNGTADHPIVFTSTQLVGLRLPGDWIGIILAATANPVKDKITYTRIEYAGYHTPVQPGAALLIDRAVLADSLTYVQTSYSAGDGFRSNATDASTQYMKYLLAFGCAGNDFAIEGSSRVIGQFLVGFKDPAFADQLGSDGLLVQSAQPATISNLSLMGYSGLGRNANNQSPPYGYSIVYDDALNPNAGRGVHIGGMTWSSGAPVPAKGTLQLFNSLVAAPFLAGISVDGPDNWTAYENGGSIIRHTTVTRVVVNSTNSIASSLPARGYVFSAENTAGPVSGFQSVGTTPQQTAFTQYNDSANLMMVQIPYTSVAYYDDLGIKNMALYSQLTHPVMIAQSGSPLSAGADFTDSHLGDPFFDATGTFRGAFGTNDWTKAWTNYVPQQTSY